MRGTDRAFFLPGRKRKSYMTLGKKQGNKVDFGAESQNVDMRLLRSLALGGRHSNEIQLLIDSQALGKPDYEALALAVSDLSVDEQRARATFEALRNHQDRLQKDLGRLVGIKVVANDLLENVEKDRGIVEEDPGLTLNQLTQMAFTDFLTGLANLRYFNVRFKEEVRRAERYHRALSLVMMDLDHFKEFNDKYGHPTGNCALEYIAATLRDEIRDTDLAARYGGEEFVLALHETSKREAMEMAERIRREIETHPVCVQEGNQMRYITVSMGVATFPRDARTADDLISAADKALYASKRNGRNRVSLFEPATSVELSYQQDGGEPVLSVSVVGDFNGWDQECDKMEKTDGGLFKIKLNMVPGSFQYKYIINQSLYINDPKNSERIHDNYGGWNSVLVVPEPKK